MGYNLVNPFPKMIERIGIRVEKKGDTSLLPFPKSKVILDLINVSKENASEISLHPQMKKKEKVLKKKGKNWMALKEYKNKNEYYDEVVYLAVSSEYGFIRVKQYEGGKIDPGILGLNKNKKTFTKFIDAYDEVGKTYVISDYSNDGNLQSYVTRLKTASVTLNEEHI